MKVFLSFLVMFVLSAGITFFLTHNPVAKPQPLIKPLSESAFSVEDAPSDSLRGHIATMSGEILWQSRVATAPAALITQPEILQGENIVTKETGTIVLDYKNAARITIQPDSELDIVQSLPANLVMTQQSGTITFEKLGSVPLSVKSSNLLVNQDQGKMSITVSPDQTSVTVDVLEGTAHAAYTDENNTSQVTEIPEGNEFVFDISTQTSSLKPLTQ
jgi:hypothetical protein